MYRKPITSLGYGMTCFESTYYGNHYLGSQFVGTGMIGWGDVSFILSNDLFAEKHQDRWRTSAAELTIGDISIGTYVLTNDGQHDSNRKKKNKDDNAPLIGKGPLGAWLKGNVYSSPIWFGIKHKGQMYRYGYSSKYVQTLTQNAVHKYISPTPFFIDYDKMNVVFFSYFGYNNVFRYGIIKKTRCCYFLRVWGNSSDFFMFIREVSEDDGHER